MDSSLWILIIFWIAFGFIHSLTATLWFKEWVKAKMGHWFKYYRLMYSFFALISLLGVLYYQFHIPSKILIPHAQILSISGMLIATAGLVLMGLSVRGYFFNISGLDVFLKKEKVSVLNTAGIHQLVRHPLYLGTLLFIWGWLFIAPSSSNLVSSIMITLYTFIGMYFEEKKLLREFGSAYRIYQQKVPMIVPLLKKTKQTFN
ncbi:methyltransferase family protein [Hydrotalea sp.]|uniref:methyltransferase family protein n=1 Tax=Hydrotalea sp. TaxID=2881279 RepID=UPI003D0DCFB2